MTTPSLKERVLAATRETTAPTRAAWRVRALAVALGMAVLWLCVSLMHGVSQWFAQPGLYMPICAGGFVLTVAVLSRALWGFFSSPLGLSRARMLRNARMAVPVLCATGLLANVVEPQTLYGPSRHLVSHLACPTLLLVGALIVAALLLYVLKGADPVAPHVTALNVGAASGAWVGLAVVLQCHYSDPGHVLLTHMLPILVVMSIVRRVGTRVLSVAFHKPL